MTDWLVLIMTNAYLLDRKSLYSKVLEKNLLW
jgi:hypothetical protein